jgi:hypothetical protein
LAGTRGNFSTRHTEGPNQGEVPMAGSHKKNKLSILLGILLFFLFNYPLLDIFNRDVLIGGIPLMPLYLFSMWVVAVAVLYLLGRWLSLSR